MSTDAKRATADSPASSSTEDALDAVADAAADAGEVFEPIGRVGWVIKGVVYALIGALFLRIAFGGYGGHEANQAGALESIAGSPAGGALLVVVGAGLALYAVWRIFTVVLPGDWTGRALLDRIGYLVSALIYISLLFSIVGILRDRRTDPEHREDRLVESLVKQTLAITAGRTLVVIAGLAVVVIGIVFARKGWTRSFRSQISCADGMESRLIDRLGTVGWTARGISMAIIGAFLIRAAWIFDADEAAGLDDSIRQLADNPFGAVLAAIVGFGFIVYGAFASLSARHRILGGPRND